jgi:hypothetical protein
MTSFVDLAKSGKSFGDIKKLADDVYGDKALKKTQIYKILKQVKMVKNQRGFTKQKTKMTADLIASVAAAVAEGRRVSIQDLARALWDVVWHHQSHPAQPAWAGKEAVVHTAKVVQEFLAKKKDQTALPPPLFI